MHGFFISPNYHVMFVHFPLALVSVGVLIELFAFLWKRSAARTAAHWMILLGSLAAVPTATSGLYAFANVAQGSSQSMSGHEEMGDWSSVTQSSRWDDRQWQFMQWHIILTCAATGLFLIVSIVYLGASDSGRARLHAPFLVLLICGLGLMVVGAWFSGEGVYRYGIAAAPPASTATPAGDDLWEDESAGESQHGGGWQREVRRYLPPLQVHTVFAGVTVALAAAGIGTMYRRWNHCAASAAVEVPEQPIGEMRPREVMPGGNRPDTVAAGQGGVSMRRPPATIAAPAPPRTIRVAWLFGLALLVALITAVTGLWFSGHGDWRLSELRETLGKWFSFKKVSTDERRMAIHAVLGGGIALFTLVMALLTRFSRRARVMPVLFVLLLLIAVGLQVYVGIALLYVLKPTVL